MILLRIKQSRQLFDEAVLQIAADDFGHVVHNRPAAVLRPSDAQDIAKLVQFANNQGLKVPMRGQNRRAIWVATA